MIIKFELGYRHILAEFAEKNLLAMRVGMDINENYCVSFENCETLTNKKSCVLSGTCGRGKSLDEAFLNYKNAISGKILVVNAMGEDRREIEIPF